MPCNRFFVDQPLKTSETITLGDSEYHHMTKVMRLKPNEIVELINGKGYLAKATIEKLSKESAFCLIKEVYFEEKPSKPFIIAQSLLRAPSLDLIVEKNTELGVDSLWFFPSLHSEKDSLSHHQLERLHKHTLSAIKQCGRLYLPEIRCFKSLAEILSFPSFSFLYGDISSLAPSLKEVLKDLTKVPLFFVGPEKGFHEKEIVLLNRYKAHGVSLHRNILRAETASIAASTLLSTL